MERSLLVADAEVFAHFVDMGVGLCPAQLVAEPCLLSRRGSFRLGTTVAPWLHRGASWAARFRDVGGPLVVKVYVWASLGGWFQ